MNFAIGRPLTIQEVVKATKQLLVSFGKAPDSDAIPAETYKAGGLPMAQKPLELFTSCLNRGALTTGLEDAPIVHFNKLKDSRQSCDNNRGYHSSALQVSFLSEYKCSTAWYYIVVRHLENGLLSETQSWTIVITACQLQVKSHHYLYPNIVGLPKAFDTASQVTPSARRDFEDNGQVWMPSPFCHHGLPVYDEMMTRVLGDREVYRVPSH